MITGVATKDRRGYTIMEVLIASALMSALLIGAWRIYVASARGAERAAWYTRSEVELRNALRMLREDLARASYASTLHINQPAEIDRTTLARYLPGRLEAGEDVDETLLTWYVCRPDRNELGDPGPDPAERMVCTLSLKGNVLHYTRTGSFGGSRDLERELVHQVEWVEVSRNATGDPDVNTCTLKVKTVHPTHSRTGVEMDVSAKVEVVIEEL